MQGANLESARVEVARDQTAGTPKPSSTVEATAKMSGWLEWMVKSNTLNLDYSRLTSGP